MLYAVTLSRAPIPSYSIQGSDFSVDNWDQINAPDDTATSGEQAGVIELDCLPGALEVLELSTEQAVEDAKVDVSFATGEHV